MRKVFADTFYWIALANPRDAWHARAQAASKQLENACIVTTDEVLGEFLTQFAAFGPSLRNAVASIVWRILDDFTAVEVVAQSHHTFLAGLQLYEKRQDKSYSFVDCVSMETMRQHGINEVLTGDQHFAQEGFLCILK